MKTGTPKSRNRPAPPVVAPSEEVKQNWISVKDRLPENTKDVLCLPTKGKMFVGSYTKGHEIEFDDEDYDGEFDPIEERNGTLYLKEGWYECEEQVQSAHDQYWVKRIVKYWMPLPAKVLE